MDNSKDKAKETLDNLKKISERTIDIKVAKEIEEKLKYVNKPLKK